VSEQDSKESEEERLDSEQVRMAYLCKHSIVSRKVCTASRVSLSSEQKRLNCKQERLDSGQ
jgi:hypothetical protein